LYYIGYVIDYEEDWIDYFDCIVGGIGFTVGEMRGVGGLGGSLELLEDELMVLAEFDGSFVLVLIFGRIILKGI
jgi:hypothetical protein